MPELYARCKVIRANDEQAALILDCFWGEIGERVAAEAYGWTASPRPHPHGVYYLVYCHAVPGPIDRQVESAMGWASLVPHPYGGEWELAMGLFPDYHAAGYRAPVRHAVCHEAFERWGAEWVTRSFLTTNVRMFERAAELGAGDWPVSGFRLVPRPQIYQSLSRVRWYAEILPGLPRHPAEDLVEASPRLEYMTATHPLGGA